MLTKIPMNILWAYALGDEDYFRLLYTDRRTRMWFFICGYEMEERFERTNRFTAHSGDDWFWVFAQRDTRARRCRDAGAYGRRPYHALVFEFEHICIQHNAWIDGGMEQSDAVRCWICFGYVCMLGGIAVTVKLSEKRTRVGWRARETESANSLSDANGCWWRRCSPANTLTVNRSAVPEHSISGI